MQESLKLIGWCSSEGCTALSAHAACQGLFPQPSSTWPGQVMVRKHGVATQRCTRHACGFAYRRHCRAIDRAPLLSVLRDADGSLHKALS